MFIDLTRHGGDQVLRVAAAAIAYLTEAGDSTAVHLMGGQSLRVAETIGAIEDKIAIATVDPHQGNVLDALNAIQLEICTGFERLQVSASPAPAPTPEDPDEDLHVDPVASPAPTPAATQTRRGMRRSR